MPSIARADTVLGGFEIDGNLVDQPDPANAIDWETASYTPFDDATGQGDDSFQGSSKELNPGGWSCITSSVPQKDDILSGAIGFRTFDGKQWAYGNYTRKGVNGDAHIDYEFHQAPTNTAAGPACPQLPKRTDGDILIAFDTENGGATINVTAYVWKFNTGSTTTGTFTAIQTAGKFAGQANIPNTIPNHVAGDFGEAILNLTDTIGTIECGEFAGVYMKTRTATGKNDPTAVTSNAALADRTVSKPLDLANCPNVSRTKTASPNPASVGQEVTYTITYTNTGGAPKTFPTIVDNYDQAHIDITEGSIVPAGTDNGDTITWTNITVPANGQTVLTYKGTVTGPFSGSTGVPPCATGQYKVLNTVTDSQGTFDGTLCVNAAPNVTRVKTVSPPAANVGQEVTYTITYTNSGAVAKTFPTIVDNYDQAHIDITEGSIVPAGTDNGDTITWTNITVPANGQTVLTYKGTVIGTFSSPGGAPCTSSQFRVMNTVTDSQGTFDGTLRVNAAPNVTRVKTVSPSPANLGQEVTYTITYTNSGAVAKTFPTIVDNYDQAHIDITEGSIVPAGTDNGDTITWTNITVPANGQTVLTYKGTVIGTFGPGGDGVAPCASGQFKVLNTVTDSQGTFNGTLCVNAAPNVTRTKVASPSPATIGQEVTYTITYTNTGPAAKTFPTIVDNYDQAHLTITPGSIVPAGTDNGDTITWTNITVPANGQVVLTYKGTVHGPFSGSPGGAPCTSTQFRVLNTVTDSQGTFDGTLCVTAPAILGISKTACPAAAVPGGVLTYTITFSNTGQTAATGVTVTDTWPAGTPITVVSTDGGTLSGNTITWGPANIGTLDPGETNTRTVQVVVDASNGETLQDTATITATGVTSATTGVVSVPVSNAGATTHGTAYGADADLLSLALINELARVDTTAPPTQHADDVVLPLSIPGLVSLGLVTTTSDSSVTNEAESTATAQTLGVNLLSGAITADVVRGVSTSTADANFATTSSAGSTFANLKINGNSITNVAPNTTVDVKNPLLPTQTVARVVLQEEIKTATFANNKFTSTHTVNMIHVTLLKPFLTLPKGAEIIVSHANTDATYPSGLACGTRPGLVSGNAFNAWINGTLPAGQQFANVQVGDAEITPLGGDDSDGISAAVPGVVLDQTIANEAHGTIAGNPSAWARSRVEDVVVLDTLMPGGLVTADVLDVKATSTTSASSATTTFATTFTNVRIATLPPLSISTSPNSTYLVNLPTGGYAVIVINEQISSNGAKDTFGTVNALHVFVYSGLGILTAEVIVGHAHSDAHHA